MKSAQATRRFLKSRGWWFSRYSQIGCGHRGAWTKHPDPTKFGSLLYCLRCNRGIDIRGRSGAVTQRANEARI